MPKTLKQHAIDIANAFTRWGLWQGGGSTTLADLTDVNLTDLQENEVLQYNGNEWINAVMQGGGSVGGKVEYITQIGVLPIPIQYSNYDIIIFVVPSTDNAQIVGGLMTPSEKLPTQVQIPVTNNGRVIISNTNMISYKEAYCGNVLVYGVKFAPIEPNLHEYSTEEKVIGKWIDGKPIYEKVISGFTAGSPSNWTNFYDCTNLNIDNMISIKGFFNYGNERNIYIDSRYSSFTYVYSTKFIQYYNTQLAQSNYETTLIIQYTKTID